jgi:hypothetical protein
MKTILQAVFISLLFSLNGYAQIVDVKNSWNYLEVALLTCGESARCSGESYQNNQYTFGNDTIINNLKYQTLISSYRHIHDTISYTYPYPVGYLRDAENHKKVYYLSGGLGVSEVLLYDFTIKKDSVFKSVQTMYGSLDTFSITSFSAKVLKTDSIITNGTKRLRIHFDDVRPNWNGEQLVVDTLVWIEDIGANMGLIEYPYSLSSLLCFKHDNKPEYVNNYGLDCLYSGPPNFVESIKRNDIKVYPNPVKNILNIQSEKPIHTIVLYRITGEKVDEYFPDDIFYQIALKNQRSGIYILSIDGIFRKIVIE